MTVRTILVFIIVLLVSCNHIETGNTLKKSDIERIQRLNLLGKDEKILKFYSEFKNEVAGNFFTDKRLAKYWIDEKDKAKDALKWAAMTYVVAALASIAMLVQYILIYQSRSDD